MTNDERKDIVLYRLENAKNTLPKSKVISGTGFTTRPSIECIMLVIMQLAPCWLQMVYKLNRTKVFGNNWGFILY